MSGSTSPAQPEPSGADPSFTSSDEGLRSGPDPLPLEPQRRAGVGASEQPICPNCDTPLRSATAVLCPSCGCDLLRHARRPTVAGRALVEDSDDRSAGEAAQALAGQDGRRALEGAEAHSAKGRSTLVRKAGTTVPLAVAAAALLTVTGFALLGWPGVFPREGALFFNAEGVAALEAPRWTERMLVVGRMLVHAVTLAAALLGGVLLPAVLRRWSSGDLATLLARIVAIAAIAQLALLIPLAPPWLERVLELATQAALVFIGALLCFRLTLRDASIVLGATVGVLAGVQLAARAVVWAG